MISPDEATSIRHLLARCAEADISFWYASPQGNYILNAAQVLAVLDDQQAFDTQLAGVTVEQYRQWPNEGPYLRCPVITRQGGQCRGTIHCSTPAEWHERWGEPCIRHRDRLRVRPKHTPR
jgi:hypothetical protein